MTTNKNNTPITDFQLRTLHNILIESQYKTMMLNKSLTESVKTEKEYYSLFNTLSKTLKILEHYVK